MAILGYSFYGHEVSEDDSVSLKNVKFTEYSGAIIDEISIRDRTDIGLANVRDTSWNNDQMYLAKFTSSLEAGNLSNEGVLIEKFKIVRRLSNQKENEDIFLGEVEYSGGDQELEFIDVTNPNTELIYSIIPVGQNGLDGQFREIEISSDFTGIWIVDKDTKEVLVFDKAIGSVGNVESTLNQNRTQIDTFNKYPQFYYAEQNFESFTLSTVVLPDDGQRTGKKYKEILDNFILDHNPKIVKTDNGKILVANISNLRVSTPMNTWENHDYMNISVDVTECYDYEKFMKGE